ncbi:MAG TPA: MMPL family transporter [Jatrophihabitans sp.]|nr:MMPL family transporter [Jatrophihabitans sp.]
MARYLYRLAKASFRHRRVVLAAWLLLLVLLGVGAATLSKPTSDKFTIPGVEAQRAIDLLSTKFPGASANGAQALVVFQAPSGKEVTGAQQQAAIENAVTRLGTLEGVSGASDPFKSGAVSADRTIALSTVSYPVQPSQLTAAQRDALVAAPQAARSAGLTVVVGGDAVVPNNGPGSTELIGVVVGAVVLAITFGSLIAAGLPLLTALIGVGVGLAGLFGISHWVELSSTAPILALMLGLAVGIDYALFIISRYRHELISGIEPEEAIGRAAGTAGSAVVFAGLTVLIALAGLSVVGIPFLTVMGLAAAGTVAVAVLIALTLLPAILGFAGRKIVSGRIPGVRRPDHDEDAAGARPSLGRRWVAVVTRRRWPAVLISVLALGLIAIPVTSMRTALPDNGTAAPGSPQRQAYDLIAKGFGPGVNGPLTVVLTGPAGGTVAAAGALSTQISALPDVLAVQRPVPNRAGDTVLLPVVPKSGPSSEQTTKLVSRIRALAPQLQAQHRSRLYVTGATALQIDVSNRLTSALPVYLVVVIGLALILLLLVFRSILVPVKATLGFLLTIGSTFGALVAVYQRGWLAGLFGVAQTAPIVSFLPIIVIAILFGLAMDYEVFLVSRMREDFVHGDSADEAVRSGFGHGARVVTAAAIIMTSVFAGFIFASDDIIKSVGFALAFGVLVDAFVVRMTIVPAVMSLVGRAAWWLPRWLDRALPNVDVEGERLLAELAPDGRELEPV